MIKRTFLLFVACMLLIALASPQVQARKKEVRVNWRFAGTFITNIVQVVNPMTGDTAPTALVHGQLKGRPGRAELRVFAGRSTVPVFSADCFDGAPGLALSILENPIVITFPNLSLLFAKLAEGPPGDFCLELDTAGIPTGRGKGVIPIMFTGGRGKYKDASGQAVIEAETEAVSSNGNFSGETATVKGTIILP